MRTPSRCMAKLATNIVKKVGASETFWSFLKVRFRGSSFRLRSSSDTLSAQTRRRLKESLGHQQPAPIRGKSWTSQKFFMFHYCENVSFCSQMSPPNFLTCDRVLFSFRLVNPHYHEKLEIKPISASDQIRDRRLQTFVTRKHFRRKKKKCRLGCTIRAPVIFGKTEVLSRSGGRILSVSHTSS